MEGKRDWYKHRRGKTLAEDTRRGRKTLRQVVDLRLKRSKSKYDLRLLGVGQEEAWISEEERESHMHIVGTTGEGKSKFLEYLIREDIDRGNGLCFFDPSDRGDTMYKVLSYCEKKKHEKVLVIDPSHTFTRKKVCPLPQFGKYKDASVAQVLSNLRILYGQGDWSTTPIIRRYLKAVLSLLFNAKVSLSDAVYFTEPLYEDQRDWILCQTPRDDRQRRMIEYAFYNKQVFMEYQSTVRRLEELFHPALNLMFGVTDGIRFDQLIADGWVVLVNLYQWKGIEEMHTRLLATSIINEIISSVDRLKEHGWKGRYYIYIDEAGLYTTESVTNLLTYKRKSGLNVILAHQYADQFKDKDIRKAVQTQCKIKIAFAVVDAEDRLQVVKSLYGGQLDDREVSYALSNLRKQHAVIKFPKQPAQIVRIPDVKDLPEVSDDYLNTIYSDPIYRSSDDILKEQKGRIKITTHQTRSASTQHQRDINEARRKNNIPSKQASTIKRRSTGKSRVPEPEDAHEGWESLFEQSVKRPKGSKGDGEKEAG